MQIGLARRMFGWFRLGGPTVDEGTQITGPRSSSGAPPAPVNFDTAMSLSAVWASARLISESIASLPLQFFAADGQTQLDRGVLFDLFSGKVNRYQTRQEFFETMLLNLSLTGNAYAVKQYVGDRLVGLLPIMTAQIETRMLPDGSIVHVHYHHEGVTVLSEQSVWHVKLFGNSIVGLSPLAYAARTMGIAMAAENRVAQIFKNGGKPTGLLTVDKVLNKDQRDHIRQEFNELREGNGDRLMVLEAEMKYEAVSMTPEDIQLLESRRFSLEDIARWMGVPSVLINDTSGSTVWGSGIQEIVQGFYKLSLRPYLERLEASMVHNLLPPLQASRTIAQFDFDALTRNDLGERLDALQKGIQSGIFMPNEARKRVNLPPVANGDTLMVNGNMVPIEQAGQQQRLSNENEESTV